MTLRRLCLLIVSVITAFKMFQGCFNAFSDTAKQIHRILNMWIHSIGLISLLKKIILVKRKKERPHSVSYICSHNINRYNHGSNIELHFSMHNLIRFEIAVSRSTFKAVCAWKWSNPLFNSTKQQNIYSAMVKTLNCMFEWQLFYFWNTVKLKTFLNYCFIPPPPPPHSVAVRRPNGPHLLLQLCPDVGAAAGERLWRGSGQSAGDLQ